MTSTLNQKARRSDSISGSGKKKVTKAANLKPTTRPPIRGLLPFVVLLALWQVLGTDNSTFFPRPSTWFVAVIDFTASGKLGEAFLGTFYTFLVALVLATVIGVVLGILVGSVNFLDRMLNPLFEFIRAMPSSAQVPIFVLLLGYGESMKLTVVILTAIFPILLNARTGMREMNPLLSDVASTLHLGTMEKVKKVIMPSLFSSIITGVRIATPVVLIVTLIVEILTQLPGLGGSLALAQAYYQTPLAYGLIVITSIVALLVNIFIGMVDERLFRHLRA